MCVAMAAGRGDPPIKAHIESVSTRAESDTERLMAALLGCCWPGGVADRREPGALEWVRRWGPRRAGLVAIACSCNVGRCQLCN
jgi:hypothetical protein